MKKVGVTKAKYVEQWIERDLIPGIIRGESLSDTLFPDSARRPYPSFWRCDCRCSGTWCASGRIHPTDRRTGAVACGSDTVKGAAPCIKNAAGILPRKQARRQRLVRPARDEYWSISWKLGAEQDVSEETERRTDRTERWKNKCLYVQNKSKDTCGDNSNIKENESVTAIQNL